VAGTKGPQRGSSDNHDPVKKKVKAKKNRRLARGRNARHDDEAPEAVVAAASGDAPPSPAAAGAAGSDGPAGPMYLAVDSLPDMVQTLLDEEKWHLSKLQHEALEAQKRGLQLQGLYLNTLAYPNVQAGRLQTRLADFRAQAPQRTTQ
jgi:hypothetical protein